MTTGWVQGIVNGKTFTAKLYAEPSKHGIDGGRISKLIVSDMYSFDRGEEFNLLSNAELRDIVAQIEAL